MQTILGWCKFATNTIHRYTILKHYIFSGYYSNDMHVKLIKNIYQS